MKKSLLTLVSVMLTSMSALAAGWVEPIPEFTAPVFDGTPQFLYNTEAKGFFCGGNDWNTRASISTSMGDSIYFQPVAGAEGSYYFRCYPSVAKKGNFFFVSANDWQNSWVDAPNDGKFHETLDETDAYPGVDKWALAPQGNNIYKIYNTTTLGQIPEFDPVEGVGYYGIAEYFKGEGNNTRTYFYDPSQTYTYVDKQEEEHTGDVFTGSFYDEWRFVSQEAYGVWVAKKAIFDAAVALGKAIDDAKEQYPGINLTDVEAVFNDYTSTLETLKNALEVLLPADIEAYVNGQIDNASLDNPVNITSRISHVYDGYEEKSEVPVDWKRIFIGSGSTGSLRINTWSTEATEDGMVTPFIENWTGAGGLLSDQKVYRDTVEVRPGAYKITVKGRLFNESEGATYLKGANVFANITRKSITKEGIEGPENAIDGAKYAVFNGKLYYYKDDFEGYGVVGSDGKLIFGMYIKDANCNWLAHKNYQVYYLGDSFESLDYVRQNTNLLADAYDEEVVAQKSLVGEYNTAVASYNAATDAASIISASAKIAELQDSVANNIAAYKAYTDRLDFISNYMANEGATLAGDDVDLLTDYLDGDEGPTEVYPNGFSKYILAQLTLNTPEIKAELDFLENLYTNAIRNGMSDGTDLTSLIVNPGFEEADGKGWSLDTHNGAATNKLTNWHGGTSNNYCAEAFEQNFDVYQVIENVPNGLYEVSVQAFYRTTSNQAAYDAFVADPKMEGDAKVLSYVYFNSFANPVKSVMEIQYEENLANNCWSVPGTDPQKYTLDGMASASTAFSLPDENVNFTQKVYGLVTDGKIRLGIRNLEGSKGARWTLWDNFKLVYRAKNPDAIAAVLEAKLDEYSTYVADQSDNDMINSSEKTLADDAIDNAEGALQSGNADKMWNALIAINDAYTHTQEHVAIMTETRDVMDELSNAINEYSETASAEAVNKANEILGTDYDNLTNEELSALSANAKDAIAELKIPATHEASDENPVDFTEVIVNHDIEQGATVGWKFTKTSQNGPNLDNGIEGKSIEFWNPSASGSGFNIYQEIAHLPAGKYELAVTAANSLNGETMPDPENGGRAFLYAATYTTESDSTWFSSSPVEVQAEAPTEKYAIYSVIFSVKEGELVTIGVKNSGTMDARWFVCDNFTLKYFGTESQHEDSENPMSVDGVEVAEGAQIVAIYTVSGAPVATLQKGLNIVKYADGSVKKIFVK